MDIPLHIIEQDEEVLKKYIAIKKELDEVQLTLYQLEARFIQNMANVKRLIGDYLPEDNSKYSFMQEEFYCRKIIPNLRKTEDKSVMNVLATEECLHQSVMVMLELKEVRAKEKELLKKLKEIN